MVKICQGVLYQLYVDLIFIFCGEDFSTDWLLIYDKSMVIKQDWLFCYNIEEDIWLSRCRCIPHSNHDISGFPRTVGRCEQG